MRAKFMAEVSIYDPSMLVGLTKVAATEEIASESMAIASVAYVLLTTEFWYEVLDTQLFL